jgi:Holliday junction resolvase RusA-like endonuclease
MVIRLTCVPPSVTAQQKRLVIVKGKPRFFHDARMKREEQTWAALLAPHTPDAPLSGPVYLRVRMTWPFLKATPKKHQGWRRWKETKPDCSNVVKHLEDLLVKLRFVNDDSQVARLVVEKCYGAEQDVGIDIELTTLPQPEDYLL